MSVRPECAILAGLRPLDAAQSAESDRRVILRRDFTFRRWHLGAIILFAWALHFPTLRMGFFADDYTHQVVLRGLSPESPMRPWSLYDFGYAPKPGSRMWELGAYPWWTPHDWKARFFRPLTSVSLWLDHSLFGGWAAGYHLTSMALYAGLILLLIRLFRDTGLDDRTNLLASLIFVAGDSSLMPVGWPANRNSLLEVFFLVAAAILALRAARNGGRASVAAAIGCAVGSVLSKESGIVAFVLIPLILYWFNRNSDDPRDRRQTVVTTVICAFLAVAYLAAYVGFGYGTTTIFYPAPWTDPVTFLTRLSILAALAPLSFIGYAPVDILGLAPHLAIPSALLCAIPGLWLCIAVSRRVRNHPTAWLWAGWLLLTVLPQGTPPTSDRLLFGPAVGAAALLAIFVTTSKSTVPSPRLFVHLRRTIVIGTLVVSPLGLAAGGSAVRWMAKEGRAALMKLELGDPAAGPRELFLLQAPNELVTAMALSTLAVERDEPNVRLWPIQLGGRGLRWTRVDERTFDFETLDKPFFTHLIEFVFLTSADAPPTGTVWESPIFKVEALESRDNQFRKFRMRLNESPENPRYRFYAVDADLRFRLLTLPAIGTTIQLPRVPPPFPFL